MTTSVENLVTPVAQAIFNHELFFLSGGSGAACHARHRADARAFAGRVGIAYDAADRATNDSSTDSAAGRLAPHLFRDFLTLRQVLLVPSHVDTGRIDHDVGAAPGAGGGGDQAHENEGISDSFHG